MTNIIKAHYATTILNYVKKIQYGEPAINWKWYSNSNINIEIIKRR